MRKNTTSQERGDREDIKARETDNYHEKQLKVRGQPHQQLQFSAWKEALSYNCRKYNFHAIVKKKKIVSFRLGESAFLKASIVCSMFS